MTEYAAIRIVSPCRCCTHEPTRPKSSRQATPTVSEAPAYRSTPKSETNRYGTILSLQVGMHPLARGRPGVVWLTPCHPELYEAHCPPASGLPRTNPTSNRSGDAHS